ncbi:MAG: hypothetical protein VX309_03495 [Pseudomonadota bacterium]|nr:hypothetical protein [Pseudomonadota bacterium]
MSMYRSVASYAKASLARALAWFNRFRPSLWEGMVADLAHQLDEANAVIDAADVVVDCVEDLIDLLTASDERGNRLVKLSVDDPITRTVLQHRIDQASAHLKGEVAPGLTVVASYH